MTDLLSMMIIINELLFGTPGQGGYLRRPPAVNTLRLVVAHVADGVVELLQSDARRGAYRERRTA